MQRKASAVWQGGLKDGKGSISTDSGVLKQTQYSFSTRFENGVGTNPEELLAAAHAGCFTMALSAQLGNAGLTASKLAPVFLSVVRTSNLRLFRYILVPKPFSPISSSPVSSPSPFNCSLPVSPRLKPITRTGVPGAALLIGAPLVAV